MALRWSGEACRVESRECITSAIENPLPTNLVLPGVIDHETSVIEIRCTST